MKTKLLTLILVLTMLLTFAACNSDSGEEQTTTSPTTATTPATSANTGTPTDPVSDYAPLMWRVTCPEGQTMHLFGSIHVGEESFYPLPEAIMAAFTAADYLAVEADIVAFTADMDNVMMMTMLMMYGEGESILDEIDEELVERAREVLAGRGTEAELLEMLDMFRPMMWQQLLLAEAMEQAELAEEHGLDNFFLNQANERDMPILEIETMQDQLAVLLGFSPSIQSTLLEESLDIDLAAQELLNLVNYWRTGDLAALTALRNPDDLGTMTQADFDEYMDGLLYQRDIGMADAVEQFFAEGKNVFYVVGVLHFVGEGSVIDLLEQRGYTVELVAI
jgi:hypothetical protein